LAATIPVPVEAVVKPSIVACQSKTNSIYPGELRISLLHFKKPLCHNCRGVSEQIITIKNRQIVSEKSFY